MMGGNTVRNRGSKTGSRKGSIMSMKHKLFSAIKRGLEVSGMNAIGEAGYSESMVEALEDMNRR